MVLIVKYLNRAEFTPSLCLLAAEGPFLADTPPDVPVVDLGKGGAGDALRILVGLARHLRKVRPDVVLAKLDYANELSVLATRLSGTNAPVVAGEEGVQSLALPAMRHPRLRRALLRWAYARAACVTTPSPGVLEDLKRNLGVRAREFAVIPNMLELEAIEKAAKLKLDHPFSGSSLPLIMTSGRLLSTKGHADVLRAVSALGETHPCNLLVLGEGPEGKRLATLAGELRIESRVAFLGFVPNPFALFSKADVFVSASHFEGFGNVLIEAMATGAPVVSTRVPHGPETVIIDGETGIFARSRDSADLAAKIRFLLEHPEERAAISERARAFVRRYDIRAVVPRYEAVLRVAAARHHSRLATASEATPG
jgi:glycosyltransferase involved in cell wall biosynthesis